MIYPILGRDIARIAGSSYEGEARRRHTEVPIEGVGVAHVLTEVPDDDPGYGFSDVTLARFRDGALEAHIPITGSVGESALAWRMHEHWCDLERLIRCVQGDRDALSLLDIDYELDDDIDGSSPSVDGPQGTDPGLTPRVLALIARAKGRCVQVPDLSDQVVVLSGPRMVGRVGL